MSAYLDEHLRAILGLIQDSLGVVTPPGETWESTFWTRCREDAADLRDRVLAEVAQSRSRRRAGTLEAVLVHGRGPRTFDPADERDWTWGVRIRWSPSECVVADNGPGACGNR